MTAVEDKVDKLEGDQRVLEIQRQVKILSDEKTLLVNALNSCMARLDALEQAKNNDIPADLAERLTAAELDNKSLSVRVGALEAGKIEMNHRIDKIRGRVSTVEATTKELQDNSEGASDPAELDAMESRIQELETGMQEMQNDLGMLADDEDNPDEAYYTHQDGKIPVIVGLRNNGTEISWDTLPLETRQAAVRQVSRWAKDKPQWQDLTQSSEQCVTIKLQGRSCELADNGSASHRACKTCSNIRRLCVRNRAGKYTILPLARDLRADNLTWRDPRYWIRADAARYTPQNMWAKVKPN